LPLPGAHNALIYVYEGKVLLDGQEVSSRQAAILGDGEQLSLQAPVDQSTRLLLIAARPIGEPVVQYGPFVMNTSDEIRQAIQDFQSGRLTD
jgi:redox-sensitive bicupin YhaK (pirin superfamily)